MNSSSPSPISNSVFVLSVTKTVSGIGSMSYSRNRALPNGRTATSTESSSVAEEADRMHDAIPPSERPQHDAYLSIFGIEDAPAGGTMSEGQLTMGWLAFNKYGKSVVELVQGDAAGTKNQAGSC
jgi:hypothetical protein